MSRNILGKNIETLRKFYGETLEQLGEAVFLSKTAIKNYESGDRTPDVGKTEAIAHHYGQTVENLLTGDYAEIFEAMRNLPEPEVPQETTSRLAHPEAGETNTHFKIGRMTILYVSWYHKKLKDKIFSYLDMAMSDFLKAEQEGIPEAAVNYLYVVFLKIQYLLIGGELEKNYAKDIARARSQEGRARVRAFADEKGDEILERIRIVKSLPEWSQLGDYYFALWFTFNLAGNTLSPETNELIGGQILSTLYQMENPYVKEGIDGARSEYNL